MFTPRKLLLTACLLAFITPAYSEIAYHYDAKRKWVAYLLDDMSRIDYIHTAGKKYAWAVGDNESDQKVAFFNGEKWSTATHIPGIIKAIRIYPAFPFSGKTGAAWAQGEDGEGKLKIAFFNGKEWQQILKEDAKEYNVYANQGLAWLSDKKPSYKYLYQLKQIDVNTPNEIKTIPVKGLKPVFDVENNTDDIFGWQQIDNDGHKAFYKVDKTGFPTLIFKKSMLGPHDSLDTFLYRNNKDFFHHAYSFTGDAGRFHSSLDNGKTFKESYTWMLLYRGKHAYHFNNFYNNLFCIPAMNNSEAIAIGCLDFYNSKEWKVTNLPYSLNTFYRFYVTDGGAWIYALNHKTDNYIFWYDHATDSMIDTNISLVANEIHRSNDTPFLRIIINKTVFAHGVDKEQHYAVFTYDGKKWQSQVVPGIQHGQWSVVGTGNYYIARSKEDNVWLTNTDKFDKEAKDD